MELEKHISTKIKKTVETQPYLFNLATNKDRKRLSSFFESGKVLCVIDDFEEELFEYFQIENPSLIFNSNFKNIFKEWHSEYKKKKPIQQQGRWVYFPWSGTLSHILEHDEYFKVRTSRNQNLITKKEQEKFYNTIIGVAGLSVGASITLATVLQGGARHIKLADHDRLALSNTNRIRAGAGDLGKLKTEITAQHIYEINPYAEVELFSDGLTQKNIGSFFEDPKIDVMIDEVDDFATKYCIREYAQKNKIPVVMAADNGDNGIIDIERYDKNTKVSFFHGRLGVVTYDMLLNLDKIETGRMITKLIGPENVPKRMQDSLLEIGKTIVSWPQLGGTALLNGATVAYCIRRIVNGDPLEGNRAIVSLDEKLNSEYLSTPQKVNREQETNEFKKKYNLS